jgi:hypothetical protein
MEPADESDHFDQLGRRDRTDRKDVDRLATR